MSNIIPLIVIGLLVIRVVLFFWRLTVGNQKPISANGLSIFYPVLLFLILIFFIGSKLFVDQSGVLLLPTLSITSVVVACIFGAACAIPVLLTTNYELKENLIYLKKSKTFLFVLLGIIALRFALRGILYSLMPPLSLLLFTLIMATVYMAIWRVGSYIKFRRIAGGVSITASK